MKGILFISILINCILIGLGIWAVEKLGGWQFLTFKMQNRGLAGQYEHRKNLFEQMPSDTATIVFLGDSLTEQCEWAELFQESSIVNRGISGDHIIGVLERLENIEKLSPKMIFLMIGVNDLFYHDPEVTVSYYEELVKALLAKFPTTELILQSLLPVNNQVKNITISNQAIQYVNQKVSAIAQKKNLFFLNLYPLFLDSDGNLQKALTKDGIHINGKGYQIWKNAIEQHLKITE